MKEIKDILRAYYLAGESGKKCALATVVKVEGSSYRQPGARMLVTEDGELTGAISGGCLEGDALRKALLAINQQKNKLITYDTSNEDDVDFGVQLGCNGIVHILFEYIDVAKENNPIYFLQQLEEEPNDAVIMTLFSQDRQSLQPGTILFDSAKTTTKVDYPYAGLALESKKALNDKTSRIKNVVIEKISYQALIECIAPPVSLVICGAGNDVKPLVEMASILGWETIVADGRATHATARRFPKAKAVYMARPEEVVGNTVINKSTFFVLMTHNYKYDLAVLKLLVPTDCSYIGILGPKTKLNRMLVDLNEDGVLLTQKQLSSIYGPIGLDIGAETSEEIAVAVVSEIKAVMSGRQGASLKYKEEKIHTALPEV